jgi:hypothetical protein
MCDDDRKRIQRWLSDFVGRPVESVQHLPLNYRWEFTRRHPYYQMFWHVTERNDDSDADEEPEARFQRDMAELILALVNVSGAAIAPDTEWDNLSPDDRWQIWSEGALSRIQLKGLVATLIGTLSRDALRSVSALLWQASQIEDGDTAAEYRLLRSVVHGEFPDFEGYLPDLIVTVSPSASETAISRVLSQVVREYRRDHHIATTRLRVAQFDSYLRAWDLREGWESGSYHRDRERLLRDIAAEIGLPDATICDRYKAAFRLITGHDYSPECWWQIVGRFKAAGLLGDGNAPISRRAGRTRSVAGHSESGFTSEGNFLEALFPGVDDVELDVMSDELFEALRTETSTTDIIKQFALEQTALPAIESLRALLKESV